MNNTDDIEGEVDELGLPVADSSERERKTRQSFKPSQADLCAFLDFIVGNPVLAQAMKSIGYAPNTIWVWLKHSREGNEKYLVRWPDKDGAPCQFADALISARQANLARFESTLRRDVCDGVPRVLRQQDGTPVYETDHKAMATFEGDAERARAAGIKDPFFVHDKDGARVPVIVYDSAPGALRQHAARALLHGYNPSNVSEVDTRVSGGVLIMKATKQGDDVRKIAGPPPPYAREVVKGNAGRRDSSAEGLSDMQSDLLKRLADLRARGGAANPRPSRPVDVGAGAGRHDDPPEAGST